MHCILLLGLCCFEAGDAVTCLSRYVILGAMVSGVATGRTGGVGGVSTRTSRPRSQTTRSALFAAEMMVFSGWYGA